MFSIENFNFEDHQSKCRCCLREFDKEDAQIKVTEIVEERFREITQIELKRGKRYSNVICEQCNTELRSFTSFRRNLVNKQTSLYGIVDAFIEQHGDSIKEVVILEEDAPACIEISEDLTEIEAEEYSYNDVKNKVPLREIAVLDNTAFLGKCDIAVDKTRLQREADKSKQFSCDHCEFKTNSKYSLNRHMALHVPDIHRKRFHCPACPASYTLPQSVKDHMKKKHTKDRKMSVSQVGCTKKAENYCDICKRGYSSPNYLKLHMKNHNKPEIQRQFEGCQKKIITSHLSTHQKIHLKQRDPRRSDSSGRNPESRPYSCRLCEKSYSSAGGLKLHIDVIHEGFRVTCLVENCRFSNGQIGNLKKHMNTQHRELPEETKNAYLMKLRRKTVIKRWKSEGTKYLSRRISLF